MTDRPSRLPDKDEATERGLLRHHTRTGRPPGDPGFVARLETMPGRNLLRGKPGRTRKKEKQALCSQTTADYHAYSDYCLSADATARGGIAAHRALTYAGVLSLACFLVGCVSREPENLVGTYAGDYGNGAHETIVIRQDGTFEQTITREGSLPIRNTGRWEIFHASVLFHDFVVAFQTQDPPDFSPHRVNSMIAAWHPESGSLVMSLYSELKKM